MRSKIGTCSALLAAALLCAMTRPALANPACGNGTIGQNEECDGGPVGLFFDGDPAKGACTNGDNCYFAFTCCKFNCQYVGTPGAVCQDGNSCTGPDECNQVGECLGGPNAANDTPCDDQLFCNGAETCQDGRCLAGADPCPADLCRTCNEEADSCLAAVGIPCEDGSACVDGGTCDGAGNCVGGRPNTNPCDDGLFCTVADTCSNGACVGSARDCGDGNVCTDDSCDESAGACVNANNTVACDDGSFCSVGDSCISGRCLGSPRSCDDDNICTDDACDDAADACVNAANDIPCDDGLYCTVGDTCTDGACVGTPRACGDDNVCTDDSCDDLADACVNAANTAPCDDGLFCTGADTCTDGACAGHVGDPCTDPTGCNTTFCDEAADGCGKDPLPDGTECDDADVCTIDDVCTAGTCAGHPGLLEDLCPWTVVVREHENSDMLKTDLKSSFTGDLCGGVMMIGNETRVESDVVSGEASGDDVLRLKADVVVGDDIVSAGGGAQGSPSSDNLPYLATFTTALPPGTLTAKSDGSGFWDLTGDHALASACIDARNGYLPVVSALDALPATASLPRIELGNGESQEITVGVVGGVNVIDVDGILKVGNEATLTIRGGGDPATSVVLRVSGKLLVLLRGRLVLADGLVPERVLLYGRGPRCYLGDESSGGGTLLCTPGKSRIRRGVSWTGVVYADGRKLRIGDLSSVSYAPFQAF